MRDSLQKIKVEGGGKNEEKLKRKDETTHDTEAIPKKAKKEEGKTDEEIKKRSLLIARKEYSDFKEKVRRTVFLDSLSPQVTAIVIKSALSQFGSVVNVEFIRNFTIPFDVPSCALVEMENEKQAKSVIDCMSNYPFMMSGMPRPVRAYASKADMFVDRPSPPDQKIVVRWLDQSDPEFETAKKLKALVKRHRGETFALIKLLGDEEEKLAQKQNELLQANYKKYEMVESILQDGTCARLARHYGISLASADDI